MSTLLRTLAFAPLIVGFAAPAFAEDAEVAPAAIQASATSRDNACQDGNCHYRVTPAQLLAQAETYVTNRDFAAAKPLLDALGQVPEMALQQRFLTGFIAAETGDLKLAESTFRAILQSDPGQTRVRLELARIMMLSGKEGSADYHFRLAQHDKDLPADLANTIHGLRGVLRDQRTWHLNMDVGLAPDSNINSATSAESVNVNFGPFQLPLTLDDQARAQKGVGQTGGLSAGLRVRASDSIALLFDSDARIVNHKGTFADDIQLQMAIGPEIKLGDTSSLSVQALGEQRWYGGKTASRDYGARLGFQKVLDEGQRLGLSIDGRKTNSDFSDSYSGWAVGGNFTYERVIGKSFIASASLFGRADMLQSPSYSSKSYGLNLGFGGELPLGINAGLSGSVSRAVFDAPQYVYSYDRRHDLRLFGRAFVGMRSLQLMGFSPSVEFMFSKVKSNYTLYQSDRHRVNFKFSRFF
jgi:outer membrane protein